MASRCSSAWPTCAQSLPVLLMSGYTPPELDRRGIVPPCAVLPKPFEAVKLVQAVRACIDSECAGTR